MVTDQKNDEFQRLQSGTTPQRWRKEMPKLYTNNLIYRNDKIILRALRG